MTAPDLGKFGELLGQHAGEVIELARYIQELAAAPEWDHSKSLFDHVMAGTGGKPVGELTWGELQALVAKNDRLLAVLRLLDSLPRSAIRG